MVIKEKKTSENLQLPTTMDKVIHEPARLNIMANLYVIESADFLFMMRQTGLTFGNLSAHMSKLEEAGVNYSFSEGFRDKVIDRIFNAAVTVNREVEFARSMDSVFFRIALSGVAAIVILLITIFLKEGSFSLNTFLGLSDSYNESIVYLLTGI